ncbi:hypothetical protein PAMA_005925 [Pampus argenteus]
MSCYLSADSLWEMMDDIEMVERAMPSGSSSPGDAASARGESVDDEDDDGLFYIPERRPSLVLGAGPMDTSHWTFVEKAMTPVLSYRSMTSEEDLHSMDEDDGFYTRVHLEKTDSYSSCYSLDSDDCEKRIPKVKSKDDTVSEPSDTPELIQEPDTIGHPSLTVDFTFKAIIKTLKKLTEGEMTRFKKMLWTHYSQSFNTPPQSMDMVDLVDRLFECYRLEVSLQMTKSLLEKIGKKKMADFLEYLCIQNEVRYDLSENLRKRYGDVCEDSTIHGETRPFDDVFTDLHITSTRGNGPNIDHEVVTIKKLDTNREAGKLLSTEDILSVERLENTKLNLLLITGAAGSGKSMAIRRLILNWIEKKSHQHVSFVFPLPFKELKQFEGAPVSLLDIIHQLYPETKKLRDTDYRCEDCQMMFIFDGLDEYSGQLDFENTELISDHADTTSLKAIVVNVLRGRLLYNSLVVVTSRPQAKPCIPWDTHYDEIEVRGFRDSEKDEYFKKRFTNPEHAARVIAYINTFKTLRIMCHLPLFCSLVADVCQHMFREKGLQAELPRNITFMYTKLLLLLIRQHRKYRATDLSPDEERDFLMNLGNLALNMLEQGKFKITKTEWKDTGISEVEAITNSGLCIQYVTKPYVLFQEKVISFIHPTMQEYLTALYAFLSFSNCGKNIFEQQVKLKFPWIFKGNKAMELYRSAVDKSLLYEDGKLDIFLRFLFGMAHKSNLDLLKPLCTSTMKWPTVIEDATTLIRKRITENHYPGRNDNLQRCLEELGVGASELATL